VNKINAETQLVALLGTPIKHSLSPKFQNAAFQALDLPYVYLAFETQAESLEKTVEALRQLNARGWNLTMPHKSAMSYFVDELSPVAKVIGAVNTVVNEGGKLYGDSTDGYGYMKMISKAGVNVIGKKMVLFGAGGAARAIAVQAAFDGVREIVIINRSIEKAIQLAEEINQATQCEAYGMDFNDQKKIQEAINDAQLLTNATNVGMFPKVENCLLTENILFPKTLVVSDIIYHPRTTQLLKLAEKKGCQTINGTQMLFWQGAQSFFLWTGQKMPEKLIEQIL